MEALSPPVLLIVYHEDFYEYGYPPLKERVAPVFRHLEGRGLLKRENVIVAAPSHVSEDLIEAVHTRGHIESVRSSGYFDVASLSAGGVVLASEMISENMVDNAFCFVGAAGHHAGKDGFWGFCFLNDIAIAIESLRRKALVGPLAIIDIDPHFGDGTRDIVGEDETILHVNFHSAGGGGLRNSRKNNVDIPLPFDAGDEQFLMCAESAVERVADFEPDMVFVVFGYDSFEGDYGAFRLSGAAYREFARELKGRFRRGVCYVLSGGSGVETGKIAVSQVLEVLVSG